MTLPARDFDRLSQLDNAEMRLAKALGRAPAGWRLETWHSPEARELYATIPETKSGIIGGGAPRSAPTDVYVCRDNKGVVLYVGLSLSVAQRLGQHRQSGWWKHVANIEVEQCANRDEACIRERELIAQLSPLHNRSAGGGA